MPDDKSDEQQKAAERLKAWKSKAKPASGMDVGTEKLLKNAMALNPAMKGGKKTKEFLEDVAKARKDGAAQAAAPAPAAQGPTRDLLAPTAPPKLQNKPLKVVIAANQEWLAQERTRLQEARAELEANRAEVQRQRTAAAEDARKKIAELLHRVDPKMQSPVTDAVLKSNDKLLKAVGFQRG